MSETATTEEADTTTDATVVDEFVCPHRERNFWSVGQFYDDFTQTSDDEVARLLAEAS